MTLSTDGVSMPKPRKSRAQHNNNLQLPSEEKAAGVLFRRPVCFVIRFWRDFRAVLTSRSLQFSAPVAQRIEHLPSKQRAAGSSPAGGTISLLVWPGEKLVV